MQLLVWICKKNKNIVGKDNFFRNTILKFDIKHFSEKDSIKDGIKVYSTKDNMKDLKSDNRKVSISQKDNMRNI